MGFSALALELPEATEAHRCPQLERPRLLTTGDVERLVEASLCLNLILRRDLEQQLPLEPIQLRLAATPSFADLGQCLLQHKQTFLWLLHFPIRSGQQRKQIGSFAFCASVPVSMPTFAHLSPSPRYAPLLN